MMHRQRGNILFLILLAIILFVALSYAIMGQRDGSKNAAGENLSLQVAQMTQYANLMENTVQRMMLVNDCKDTQIGFDNTVWLLSTGAVSHPANHNPNTPSDSCRVFSLQGGGMSPQTFAALASGPVCSTCAKPGNPIILAVSVQDVGTSNPDLVLFVTYFSDALCQELNNALGNGAILPSWTFTPYNVWAGSYGGATGILGTGTAAALKGKRTGCGRWGGATNDTQFYHVLIAR